MDVCLFFRMAEETFLDMHVSPCLCGLPLGDAVFSHSLNIMCCNWKPKCRDRRMSQIIRQFTVLSLLAPSRDSLIGVLT